MANGRFGGSLRAAIALAAFSGAVAAVFWPGQMDPDTVGEWRAAQSGAYSDWHSPILSALWRAAWLVGLHSAGWVLLAGVFTLLVGLYLLLRLRLPRGRSVVLACLILAFPPVLGWAVHIGKDTWFASLLICAFGALARANRVEGRPRLVMVAGTVLLGALAATARQNALPALVPLFAGGAFLLLRPDLRRRALAATGVGVLATLAVFGVETGVATVVLHTPATNPEQVVLDYDLTEMSRIERRVLFPASLYPKQDLAWLETHSDVGQADSLEFGDGHVLTVPLSAADYRLLRSTWTEAVTSHPLTYLDARLHLGLRLLGVTGFSGLVYQPPSGSLDAPLLPALNHDGESWLAAFTTSGRPDGGSLVHRIWIYALLLLAGGWRWLRRRPAGTWPLGLLAAGVLLYAAGTVFLAPAAYYRFLYVVAVAGTAAGVLLLAELLPRLAGRAAAAVSGPAETHPNWTLLSGSMPPSPAEVEVSVVLPCLNEAASVGTVVADALAALRTGGLRGEVVVSDNGSDDGSPEIAAAAGARVVRAPMRGYGNAYHAGMAAARGRVLVMADADGTYPMEAIPDLVRPVLAGEVDMVIGSRLRGRIDRQAMPWAHRYIGNPILTGVLNRFFGVTVSDAHSGMRAIDRDAYRYLGLCTPGMEYASEMIVQAARARLRMREAPIEYRQRIGDSKLETWPDGWRHLKFLLLVSPTWLFLIPGGALLALGVLLLVPLSIGPVMLGPIHLVLHPILIAAVLTIVGYQMVQVGVLLRACTPLPLGMRDRLADFVHRRLTIERVLVAGALVAASGLAIGIAILATWAASGFGALFDIRQGVLALVLFVLGAQTIFGAFLYAWFLPASFGGGVAPGWLRPEETARPTVGAGR